MYEGLDTVVLYEELAYEDVLPVAWRQLPEPFDPAVIGSYADRNLRVLQALAALDEHGQLEKPDENSPHAADILRLDLKVNLLLDMVGRCWSPASRGRVPPSIRFNALGGVWQAAAPFPELGSQGVLEDLSARLHRRAAAPGRPHRLGRAGRAREGAVRPPGEHIADLLEKLAFRKHRRQVAGIRQPKK